MEKYHDHVTCGGHSHFLKKSSLALAKNSFTIKREEIVKQQLAFRHSNNVMTR